MCGIAGLVLGHKSSAAYASMVRERLGSMLRALRHRGPDDWGMAFFGYKPESYPGDDSHISWLESSPASLALGHQRLSILDLSPDGRQPMFSVDGSCCVVFNGEIYNYIELRKELGREAQFRTKTDTEVLLEAYRQWGVEMLARLDGMFAFALWDSRKQKLICARDPLGIKPFYFTQENGRFFFASEPRGVLAGLARHGTVDSVRIAEFLLLGVSDQDGGTSYKEVQQLQGGYFFEVDSDGSISQLYQYWKAPERTIEMNCQVPHLVAEKIEKAVTRQLRSDVPVGSCLSGGLDSGSVVAAIGGLLGSQARGFKTLTLHNPNFDGDEVSLAEATAINAQVDWVKVQPSDHELTVEIRKLIQAMDEPCPSLSMLGQRKVMERASELGLKVMLDGQGGDEVFLGYPRVALRIVGEHVAGARFLSAFQAWNGFRRNASQSCKTILLNNIAFSFPELLYRHNKRRIAGIVDEQLLREARMETAHRMYSRDQSVFDRQRGELTSFCLPQLLRFEDRSSMAFGVEARVPLLSIDLVEFGLGLPLEWKIRDGWTKYALRTAMQNRLPAEVVWSRRKRGFEVPQKRWIEAARPEIIQWLENLPVNSPIRRKEMIDQINLRGGEDWFWRCLCVALWLCFSGVRL